MEDHAGEGAGAPRGACLNGDLDDGLHDWARLTGLLHDVVQDGGRLTCCFGQLGMAIRPGNARALAGPWGQMRRGDLAGGVQVTCCLEGWLRHGRSCLRGRRRSQGCVPERLSARCTSRLGEAGLLSSRRRSDWCVPERSSQGWTHNGAPWKREARTIGATSRPGAQMPISAWDHRFHGEGERQ